MHRIRVWVSAVVALVPATIAHADGAVAPEGSLQEQLVQLNATMREIATILQRQIEGEETNLLIKRIELSDRSLSSKKDRVRKMRGEAGNLKEKELSLAGALEAADEEFTDSLEIDRAQQVMLEQLEERLQATKRRRQDLERELVVLESEVRVEEEDMEVLEAVLDDRLGLR